MPATGGPEGSFVLGSCIALVVMGCRGPESPVVPDMDPSSGVVPTEAVAPDLSREARLELGPLAICAGVSVEVAAPERIQTESCHDEYLVHLVVNTNQADGAVLRMSRSYDIADWRLQVSGSSISHELGLVWRPYRALVMRPSAAGTGAARRMAVEPLVARVCPEDDGPVLACSDRSCEIYANEREVPQVVLSAPGPVFRTPWSYENVQNLREASSLDVRLRYWLPRGQEVYIGLNRLSSRLSGRGFRVIGGETVGGDRRLSGEVKFTIEAELDALEEPDSIEEFGFFLNFIGEDPACVVAPDRIRVRVRDR